MLKLACVCSYTLNRNLSDMLRHIMIISINEKDKKESEKLIEMLKDMLAKIKNKRILKATLKCQRSSKPSK